MDPDVDATTKRMMDLLLETQAKASYIASIESSETLENKTNYNANSPRSPRPASTPSTTKSRISNDSRSAIKSPGGGYNGGAKEVPDSVRSSFVHSDLNTTNSTNSNSNNNNNNNNAAPAPGERLIQWGMRRDKRIEEERRKTEGERVKQENCTFAPNLSPSQNFRRPQNTLLERQAEWEVKRQSKITEMRTEEEEAVILTLKAVPEISARAAASKGHLPDDIKRALMSPSSQSGADKQQQGFGVFDPRSVAVRQENDYKAYLLRQQRARTEKERKEAALTGRPGATSIQYFNNSAAIAGATALVAAAAASAAAASQNSRAHAPSTTTTTTTPNAKKPTIPTEPHLATADRAERGGSNGSNSLSSSSTTHVPFLSVPSPFSPRSRMLQQQQHYHQQQQNLMPMLVPVGAIPSDGSSYAMYTGPYSYEMQQQQQQQQGPVLVPIYNNTSNNDKDYNNGNRSSSSAGGDSTDLSAPAAWTRYAPEVAALLAASSGPASPRGYGIASCLDEELEREAAALRAVNNVGGSDSNNGEAIQNSSEKVGSNSITNENNNNSSSSGTNTAFHPTASFPSTSQRRTIPVRGDTAMFPYLSNNGNGFPATSMTSVITQVDAETLVASLSVRQLYANNPMNGQGIGNGW